MIAGCNPARPNTARQSGMPMKPVLGYDAASASILTSGSGLPRRDNATHGTNVASMPSAIAATNPGRSSSDQRARQRLKQQRWQRQPDHEQVDSVGRAGAEQPRHPHTYPARISANSGSTASATSFIVAGYTPNQGSSVPTEPRRA